jgi:hypothetical protein
LEIARKSTLKMTRGAVPFGTTPQVDDYSLRRGILPSDELVIIPVGELLVGAAGTCIGENLIDRLILSRY